MRSLNSVHTPDLSEPDSEVLDSMQLPPYALDYGLERPYETHFHIPDGLP